MATHEAVGLVGPNGAGKTTLFNVISGLVPARSGQVMFDGEPVMRLPMYRRARLGLGRTFQIPQPLHELSVRENLQVAQRFGKGALDERKLDEILDFMELTQHAGRDAASELSLQELKRLEVAKALATDPKLLLLDEVLAGLETAAKRAFSIKLKEMQQRYGIGILIIEHDIETIATLCPRVVVLNFGEILAEGSADEVFRNPRVVESYTGVQSATHPPEAQHA